MLFGIPLFGDRVAPRCTIADSLLIVKGVKNDIAIKKQIPIVEISWFDLLKLLIDRRVDILVCGGINIEDKELAHSKGISIIDNVAGSQDDIVAAIRNKQLKSGFGFSEISGDSDIEDFYNNIEDVIDGQFPDVNVSHLLRYVNCINCPELACE
ncbi:MAG: hypothetical protein QG635_170, partial [Bacteroidota bacterium]|nr:hypothetical protein [Bacteroidota bacterium]